MLASASIVITALLVIVIVLQIVLIVLVRERKKNKEEVLQEKPAAAEQRDFRRPKEPENRFARKPPHDHKMKPAPAPSQNVDQVERSLRDINLRLKNAEKDQEKERQRIKDTISSSSPASTSSSPRRFDNQRPPRERDDRFRRNDRQRNDFQKNRPSNNPRGFRDDRPAPRSNFDVGENKLSPIAHNESVAPSAAPIASLPEASMPIASPLSAPVSAPMSGAPLSAPAAEKPLEQVFETPTTQPESGENLQHGRKFSVKRRVLAGEENSVSSESGDVAVKDGVHPPSVSSENQLPQQTSLLQEQKPEHVRENAAESSGPEDESFNAGPISFGR